MKDRSSIRHKIIAAFLLFAVALLVALWLTQVVFLEDIYKSIKINQVKKSANDIEKHIDTEDLSGYVENISKNSGICVDVLADEGEMKASAHAEGECLIHTIPREERHKLIDEALDGETVLGYYDFRSFIDDEKKDFIWPPRNVYRFMPDTQAIIYSKAIQSESGQMVLVVNSTIAPVDATVATIRRQLYIISAATLLAGVGFALFISTKVAKPIIAINNQAKMLKKGNYDVVFTGNAYREIDELSDTLNSTAKELDKVESLRRELIANVSHDLRTPLTLISGYAEMMRDLPGENNAENAQTILDETKRLTSLVTDMLDMSKLQSGSVGLKKEDFSLTDMCEGVISRVSAMLKAENYDISFEKTENIVVNGDEQLLTQAFYNLITNAVNYTGEDRRVLVRQQKMGDFVRISVIDSGEGIAQDEFPYIWDRYYKSKANHKRARIGTGLGLSIVRSTIDMHGGNYGVESTLGEGSTFWFEVKT